MARFSKRSFAAVGVFLTTGIVTATLFVAHAGGRMNRTAALVASLVAGLVLGAGLVISGMTQPTKVIGFLDVPVVDPTLMFVLAGATGTYMLLRPLVGGWRRRPWHAERHLPR